MQVFIEGARILPVQCSKLAGWEARGKGSFMGGWKLQTRFHIEYSAQLHYSALRTTAWYLLSLLAKIKDYLPKAINTVHIFSREYSMKHSMKLKNICKMFLQE